MLDEANAQMDTYTAVLGRSQRKLQSERTKTMRAMWDAPSDRDYYE